MLVVLTLVVATAVAGSWLRSPEQAAAEAAPPAASLITVPAEQRVLAEPVVLRGLVQPGDSVKVRPPAAAVGPASVVTQVLVGVGEPVEEGQVLLAFAGQPMFPLRLPFPLYRDLAGGMDGPDVAEVQRALGRLGYQVGVTGRFDWPTLGAVGRFYADRGFTAPPGSAEAQAGLPAARGTVTAARAAYDDATDAGAGVAAAGAALDRAEQDLATMELAAGPGLPQSSVIRTSQATGTVTAVRVRVGDLLDEPDRVLCELDGGAAQVVAAAALDQVGLIAAGQEAVITDEATGRETTAVVEAVGDEPANDESLGLSGFLVRLAFTGEPMEPTEGRTVRVDLAAAASDTALLAVPLTAVYSRADGSTFVTVACGDAAGCPEGELVEVTVSTGQIAGGWVAVEPTGDDPLTPGDLVVVGHGGG
jgi:peptidoglycan hydrolase-like protein with peptidoglycan-binding domain